MPMGSGRKKAGEWDEVTEVENSTKVSCDYCHALISNKIERVKPHLKHCQKKFKFLHKHTERENLNLSKYLNKNCDDVPNNDLNISASALIDGPSSLIAGPSAQVGKSSLGSVSSISSLTPCKKQRLMSSYTISTNLEQKENIDIKIAKFFFSANVSFKTSENQEFIDMISSLRPGYKPPNRKMLGGELLEKVYEEVNKKMMDQLTQEEKTITIMQDGWSSVTNDPIIAHSAYDGLNSKILCITDCASNKKTAKYCTELLCNVIKDLKETYNKEVFAVVTDNENKMKKMRDSIKETYPNLLTYGCSAHYLNLLEKEVTHPDVIKHVVEVQKYFRNTHQPHGWLREKGGHMPQLPNDTRWNSQIDCIETYIKNYQIYVEIVDNHDIPIKIRKIIENRAIFREANSLQTQLKIFGVVLDQMQSDSCHLSECVELWLSLLNNPELSHYHTAIKKRCNDALTPIHYLAYMTNPRFLGKNLPIENEDEAEEWLYNHYPDFVPGLILLKLKDCDAFPKRMLSNQIISTILCSDWWSIINQRNEKSIQKKLPEGFCKFISKLQTCPASSGSIERIFSSFGFIWSKVRNKLGCEKAKKLVQIYKQYQK
ncbi:uncharacterized protein LOC124809189 isoform X2 [Hydra vulgaris]|uniref:uncharacterized protein LOC124809189 isoform X2 n=3 Tax=Hydra vulgaris TaxID=6087 RepID=UPI001F5E3E16|nr:uncharacterized protein LOC124809189 isoform X2 [Hydra vulgaris]